MNVSGQIHASTALPPGIEPPDTHCVESWGGGGQRRSGRGGEEKKSLPLPLPEIEPRSSSP
jgi:hypothetical protein